MYRAPGREAEIARAILPIDFCSHRRDGAADTDLKAKGLRICARGAKIAKRRAVTAVARSLAVLMAAMLKRPDTPYVPLSERARAELERTRTVA